MPTGALNPFVPGRGVLPPYLAGRETTVAAWPAQHHVARRPSARFDIAENPLQFAGTPGIAPQLNAMSATFWDRAEQIGMGLLDESATSDALSRPFEAETPPATFEAGALSRAVEASQCYPYFVQLIGAALWDVAAANGHGTIDGGVVAQAASAFDQGRGTYYHHRHNELERAGLLDVASAIARAFGNRDQLTQAEVDAAIAGTQAVSGTKESQGEAIRIRDGLAAVGYVWNPPGGGHVWRPGIPSLMAHIDGLVPPA